MYIPLLRYSYRLSYFSTIVYISSERLQYLFRLSNLAGSAGPCMFAVLLPEKSGDESLNVFKTLHDNIRASNFETEGYLASFTPITGLVTINGGGEPYLQIMAKARKAILIAKANQEDIYLVRTAPGPFKATQTVTDIDQINAVLVKPFDQEETALLESREFDAEWLFKEGIFQWESPEPDAPNGHHEPPVDHSHPAIHDFWHDDEFFDPDT